MDPEIDRTFRGHRGAVTSVAFNPNQKQVASGGMDGYIMLWNFKVRCLPAEPSRGAAMR